MNLVAQLIHTSTERVATNLGRRGAADVAREAAHSALGADHAVFASTSRELITRDAAAQARLLAIRPDALNLFGERFAQVDDRLLRGGVPSTEAHFEQLARKGVKDIVCLMDPHDPRENPFIENEKRLAERFGMKVHVLAMPFQAPVPTRSLKSLLRIMRGSEGRSIYLHCKNGRDRTGTMVAFYRMAVDGFSPRHAFREMRKFGYDPNNLKLSYLGEFLQTLSPAHIRGWAGQIFGRQAV